MSMNIKSLYHWGIKGMKWGVRRYQNKDGSLTEEGKKRLKEYASDVKTDDFTLRKGFSFQRIGGQNETDNNDRTYVSYGKKDNARYLTYSETLGRYKIDLISNNDIRVAKGKVLVDTYIEMLGSKTLDELMEDSALKRYGSNGKETKQSKLDRKEVYNIYKNAINSKESFNESYTTFAKMLMGHNEVSKEYFNRLQSKGYNAMYDYNDRKAADNPLIVFNRKQDLKTIKVSEINYKDIDKAIDYLDKLGVT